MGVLNSMSCAIHLIKRSFFFFLQDLLASPEWVCRFEIPRLDASVNQDIFRLSLPSLQQALVDSFACSMCCTLDHLLLDGLASSQCLVPFILWNSLSVSFLSTAAFPGCLSGGWYCLEMKQKAIKTSEGVRHGCRRAEGKTGFAEVTLKNRRAVGNRAEEPLRC